MTNVKSRLLQGMVLCLHKYISCSHLTTVMLTILLTCVTRLAVSSSPTKRDQHVGMLCTCRLDEGCTLRWRHVQY